MAYVAGAGRKDLGVLLAGTPHTMGIPVALVAWHPQVCRSLARILSLPPAQATLFRSVFAHAVAHGATLAAEAGPERKHRLDPEKFPLAAAVMGFPPARKASAVQRTLSWLMLEAHLTGAGGTLVMDLAQILRGLHRGEGSRLNQTILECDGPSELVAKMTRLGERDRTRITGHGTFDDLWRKELGAFCAALIRQVEVIAEDTEEFWGALDKAGPLTESPLDAGDDDPDEGTHHPSLPIAPGQVIRGQPLRRALNWSAHMVRRSSPSLLRPAENVLPAELRELQWTAAIHAAERAVAAGDLRDAEYSLLAAVSIETGLSTKEALSTGFGTSAAAGPVIDLEIGALRRPEVLPPNCFIPPEEDGRWIPTGGDVIFPLSPRCLGLLKDLKARPGTSRPASSLLLAPHLAGDGRLVPVDGAKLRAATKAANRLVLAIHVAHAMGIDAAQRAFGDTFGLSAAAAFYGSYPAVDVAGVVVSANDFMGHDVTTAAWPIAAQHVLGSRARPRDPPFSRAWQALQGSPGRARGRPSDRTLESDWQARRDRLLVHFILATGHRPTRSLFELTLHNFVPRDATVFVGDKISGPAYLTRPVCTGWRLIGELEGFLAELRRISQRSGRDEARRLAKAILAGSAPLLETPSRSPADASRVQALLKTLDPLWGYRPNVHRHGLAQHLIQARVDPELRYFQLGWQCHDHHATSDSAPYPAAQLGPEMAEVIDGWLDSAGWLGGCLPEDPGSLIPLQPLKDWTQRKKELAQAADANWNSIKAELAEAERGMESAVWLRIRAEAERLLAAFEPSPGNAPPAFQLISPKDGEEVPAIGQADVEALLAPFENRSCRPVERYVAARLLHKALLRTARLTGARVFLPSVPVLSRSREASPFIPESGLAIAQIDHLHTALLARLSRLDRAADDYCTALAATTAACVLLHTPCQALGEALETLRTVASSSHAANENWQLRVPTPGGHVLLRGDSAILARQLALTPGHVEAIDLLAQDDCAELGRFLAAAVPELAPSPCPPQAFLRLLESTASVAKPYRSNGPERLILKGAAKPAVVDARRAAAVADDVTWPSQACVEESPGSGTTTGDHVLPAMNPAHRPLRDIKKVMRAFQPDYQGEILGKPAKPVSERRRQLKELLQDALGRMDGAPTVGRVVLEYAWHLLDQGGPRSRGGQAINTIRTTYGRLAPVLRNLANDQSIEAFASEEMTALIRAACRASRARSSRKALDALRNFLDFAGHRWRVAAPDWELLYQAHGVPVAGGDPGLVSDLEAARVLERLHAHVGSAAGTDADPADRRYREVCLVAALIAEASGARPRSINGLTLADIVLGKDADYIHLRTSGRFASIKTKTSAGFIPLEGRLWRSYRPWFAEWFCRTCLGVPASDLDSIPLFQIPGEPVGVRYEMRKVFEPIGNLLRWSTQQPKARTYWLRKRRVWKRHHRAISARKAKARDLAHAMRLDGHALMVTPVTSYLAEPGAYASRAMPAQAVTTREGAAMIARVRRLNERGASRSEDLGTSVQVARLLRLERPSRRGSPLPEAPPLARHGADLTWSTVERILRDCASGEERARIVGRHGIELAQLESIVASMGALAARLKVDLGSGQGDLAPPRSTAASRRWFALLEAADARLASIAREWVEVSDRKFLDAGCQLADRQTIGLLRGVANELGARLDDSDAGYGTTLVRFVGQHGNGHASRVAYGEWLTLRWLLAVAWIGEHRKRSLAGPPPG